MTEDIGVIIPQCEGCKHYKHDGLTCDAFPNRIPDVIFVNEFDHRKPFKGDRGIQFEREEA